MFFLWLVCEFYSQPHWKVGILFVCPSTRTYLRTHLTVSEPCTSFVHMTMSLLYVQLLSKWHRPKVTKNSPNFKRIAVSTLISAKQQGFGNFSADQLQNWTDFILWCRWAWLVTKVSLYKSKYSNPNLNPLSNLTAINPELICTKSLFKIIFISQELLITKIHTLESTSLTLEIFFKIWICLFNLKWESWFPKLHLISGWVPQASQASQASVRAFIWNY